MAEQKYPYMAKKNYEMNGQKIVVYYLVENFHGLEVFCKFKISETEINILEGKYGKAILTN